MKKLLFSVFTLVALSIGATAQTKTTTKTTPAKTTSTTRTTTKSNPAGTTTMEKTSTSTKGGTATKPRHKKHFVYKKKATTATK